VASRRHHGRKGSPAAKVYAGMLFSTSPNPSLLATTVPHQVGRGRADERCVSSVSCVSDFVSSVFHLGFVKVDLGCCICYNNKICMLQAYILSVSGFLVVCLQMFHLGV
jgi:hypothetical protein